ncbi:MAG: hypothetical protein JJU00_02595 [Opitutales bacterium]|nr:hypothetical protein [Opitutales bacterium]
MLLLLPFLLLPFLFLPLLSADEEALFQARSAHLFDHVADVYNATGYPGTGGTDPGKFFWPKTVARFEKYGPEDALANQWVRDASTINTFHFYFPGLAATLFGWPDAPEVANRTDLILQRIIDSTHPARLQYNIWTSEGTENHVYMCRAPGYLFAQLAVERGITAAPGQPTPAERLAQMRTWVMETSALILRRGSAEWDSDQYAAYNAQSWIVLFDHATDPDVRAAARAVIDFYAASLALKTTQTLQSGPKQRGVPNNNGRSSADFLAWLWFSESDQPPPTWQGSEHLPSVLAAVSAYRPPAISLALARKQLERNATYRNSKPSYLLTRPSETKEIYHIGERYTMGTAFDIHGGWSNASWAIVSWKAIVENTNGSPGVLWGNGGQKSTSHARGRNPYDQFVQHRGTLIQMTRIPTDAAHIAQEVGELIGDTVGHPTGDGWRQRFQTDFIARFGMGHENNPVKDNVRGNVTSANARRSTLFHPGLSRSVSDNIVWLQLDGTYAAVRSIRQAAPTTVGNAVSDTAALGQLAGIVVELGTEETYGSFAAFQDAVLTQTALDLNHRDAAAPRIVYTTLEGDVLDVTFSTSGEWVEPDFDWNYGVTEQRVGFNTEDWIQPSWPSGEGHGRRAVWTVNGEPVDLEGEWPVHDGPNLRQADGVLTLNDGSEAYEVDFSEDTPVFRTYTLTGDTSPEVSIFLVEGEIQLAFTSVNGTIYQVQWSPDLEAASWQDLGTPLSGDGNEIIFSHPLSGLIGDQHFFRIAVTPN